MIFYYIFLVDTIESWTSFIAHIVSRSTRTYQTIEYKTNSYTIISLFLYLLLLDFTHIENIDEIYMTKRT